MLGNAAKSRVMLSRVDWAKKHIESLHRAEEAFWQREPFRVDVRNNRLTGKHEYYLSKTSEIPSDIVLIAGDVLHNLRSALDNLAYALPLAPITPGKERSRRRQFPVVDSAEKYMSTDVRRGVETFRKDVVEALDGVRPYKGGNDTLWALNELNNINKHRLILTACLTNTAQGMTRSEQAEVIRKFRKANPAEPVPDVRGWLRAVPAAPLEAGGVLAIRSKSEVGRNMQFHFQIAFNEPEVLGCKPIIDALHEMSKAVGHIILEFDSFLT